VGIVVQLFAVLIDWSKGIHRARWTMVFVTITGALAGLGMTALIALVNSALSGGGMSRDRLILAFVALCVAVPVAGFVSGVLLLRLTAQAARDMRLQMCRQILAVPYRALEQVGPHRLLATINDDIPAVTNAVTSLPVIFMQSAVIGGCLIYLGWLSWPLLLMLLGYLVLGILSYQLPLIRATKHFRLMREQWDAMFAAFRALTEGAKELRLNRARRLAFQTHQLEPATDGIRRHGIAANTLTIAAQNLGEILFLIFIGLLVFASPLVVTVDQRILTGYSLTVLYMISPLTNLLNLLPTMSRAYVAAEKVKKLGLSLSESTRTEPAALPSSPPQTWRSLEFHGVSHLYRNGGVDEFQLGPLDLTFKPGELVFLIGGNGSGKTTLAKLIMGLYEPSAGEIRLDGEAITDENLDDYRQNFSVVFYDFFLFDRLFGVDRKLLATKGQEFLAELQLDDKVRSEEDKLSTNELSQGQRKRLALLNAYLEDRPIYIFDEWASDQDPMFKKIFYYQILPDLKARGKTVIAITHDDRYYGLADRLVKLERGQLVASGVPDAVGHESHLRPAETSE
jgi:putative pyoverdin transport system ATP-binding/permease protein